MNYCIQLNPVSACPGIGPRGYLGIKNKHFIYVLLLIVPSLLRESFSIPEISLQFHVGTGRSHAEENIKN